MEESWFCIIVKDGNFESKSLLIPILLWNLKFPPKCLPIKNSGIKQGRLLNQVPFIQFISFYTFLQGKKAF